MKIIEKAYQDLRMGRPIIIVEEEKGLKNPHLTVAGENISPDDVNLAASYGSGIIYVALTPEIAERIGLPDMGESVMLNTSGALASVDAYKGATTGISTFDRSHTIRLLANESTTMQELTTPGHIFPVKARAGGVLKKAGVIEATVDMARLAGLTPVMMLTEMTDENGEVMNETDILKFAEEHDMAIVSVKKLISYRLNRELLVKMVGFETMDSPFGKFRVVVYEDTVTDSAHLALVNGDIRPDKPVLVRVHSECLTGDVFHSYRCDCGSQLHEAMRRIGKEGGVLLYLRQEGRGIGLLNKTMAYDLQDHGLDTVEANIALGFNEDMRDYGIGAQVLYHLGVRKMRLLTNNPRKIIAIGGFGLEVVERVPIEIQPRVENLRYLQTKKKKMGHLLDKI